MFTWVALLHATILLTLKLPWILVTLIVLFADVAPSRLI